MTVASNPGHLAERAANRLRETQVPGLSGLLPEQTWAPAPTVPDQASGANMTAPRDAMPEAAVPAIEAARLERAGLLRMGQGRTRISEEFQIAQGQILRVLAEAKAAASSDAPNTILVTSARPGEGKSFTALNLAAGIARHAGRSALLVDLDAKQNSISRELGVPERPGLLDLAADPSLSPEGLFLGAGLDALRILPIGGSVEARKTFSVSAAVIEALRRMARRLPESVIVLDGAPCLLTSDPSTLAPCVGQVVMVVEAERTQRSELEAALDLVHACPNVLLLLNKARLTESHTFGAYGGSGYGAYRS